MVEASPRLPAEAHAAFLALRASRVAEDVAGGPGAAATAWLERWGPGAKPEVVWEVRAAAAPGAARRLGEAEHTRQELEAALVRFLEVHEVFVCPVALMPPYDLSIRYPATLTPAAAGGAAVAFGDYTQWMAPCWLISMSGLPAISVPVGLTPDGLPLGVQLVGRMGGEDRLLAAAALLEAALGVHRAVPLEPRDKSAGGPASPTGTAAAAAANAPASRAEWDGPRTAEEAAAHLEGRSELTAGVSCERPHRVSVHDVHTSR